MVSENGFNKLFARKLLEYHSSHTPEEISGVLRKISLDLGINFSENQFEGHIDPFNAMAFCNRDIKAKDDVKKAVGEFFGFDGNITEKSAIPLVNYARVAFVDDDVSDRNLTVDKVWDCFHSFIEYADGKTGVDDFIKAFNYCSSIKGMYKDPHNQLSIGLYWIDSEKYISLDGYVQQYLSESNVDIKFKNVDAKKYLDLIDVVHKFIEDNNLKDFDELSKIAYEKKDEFNYWSYEDLDTGITEDMWLEFMSDNNLFNEDRLFVLKSFSEFPNGATCKEVSKRFGRSHNYYNNHSIHLAEAVLKKVKLENRDEENAKCWPVLYVGRKATKGNNNGGVYAWKLRDELRCALMRFLGGERLTATNTCDFDKNTILYGPPGTGKTYHTYRMAVEIIEGKKNDDFNFKEEFDRLYDAGQIRFITFHQSYSYEEFIEGIRPIVDENNSALGYELKDGVFKEFCKSAENKAIVSTHGMSDDPKVWKVSLEGTGDNKTRTECLENGHIRIGWDEYGEVISEDTKFDNGGKSVLNAFINKMQVGDIVLSCFSSKTIDAIGVVKGDYRWEESFTKYRRVRDVEWIKKFEDHPDIVSINGGKTMTLSTVYQMNVSKSNVLKMIGDKSSVKMNDKNYVFIIDEINRGNVSRIFGELITLIEEPKRLGGDEALKIKLPYSGDIFGVPSNVYIIGTMNTADRSLVALDSALRRRFSFVEMLPDYDVINPRMCGNIDLRELLKTINNRIKSKYDREHMIGHSYLMNIRSIEDLAKAFRKKIIPLIQEYFYDDEKKMISILRSDGSESSPFINLDNNDEKDLSKIFLNEDLYIGIYQKNKSENGNDDSN